MNRITVLLAVLLVSVTSYAQHFDPDHRHSIEISTGVPPVQSLLFGSNSYARMNGGFKDTRLFLPSVNVAYTYAMNERWDFNVVINACSAIFRRDYYPMKDTEIIDDEGNVVASKQLADFNGEVQSSKIVYPGEMYTPMIDFRWKWLRRDNWRLYSSFGLGCLVVGNFSLFIPTPYLTPVGVNFGSGHFYGLAELNISCASTGLLAGVGYRF